MKRTLKKWLSLIMVISCVLTCIPAASYGASDAAKTSDLTGHWAEEAVQDMMRWNVINGYKDGSFQPNKPVSRAEFIAMVNRSCGFTEEAAISFSDVASGKWYYSDIAKGIKAGYISGYPDQTFRPDRQVSRFEAASILMKVYGLDADETAAAELQDVASIPAWARGAVGAVVQADLMEGYSNGAFQGAKPITRAESAVVLHRQAKEQAEKTGQTETENQQPQTPQQPSTGSSGGSSSGGSHSGGNSGSKKPDISKYSAAFRADIPQQGIVKALFIYSEDLLYRDSIQNLKRDFVVKDGVATSDVNEDKLTVEKAELLIQEHKAKELTGAIAKGTAIAFDKNQLTLEGKPLGKGIYYPYVVTIDEKGAVEIYDSMEYIITAADPTPKKTQIRGGNGIVWPIGGATSQENYAYIAQQASVGLPEGQRPKVAILNSSRDYDTALTYMYDMEDDPDFGTYETIFGDLGMDIVWIPLNYDSLYYFEDVSYYPELIKTCDAVYLMGGDQMLHARCLLNEDGSANAYLKAVQYVLNRGGFVTGTSAGCHIMSHSIFGLGVSYDAMYLNQKGQWADISELLDNGETEGYVDGTNLYTYGAGLIPEGYLLESHFDARGRLGRLIAGLRDGYENVTVGIGPDESTGVQLQEIDGETIGTIVGPRGVFFVDASQAEYGPAAGDAADASEYFSVKNLRIDYLTEGDTYNFDTKEIVIAENKTAVKETGDEKYMTINVFGAYETTKTILNLAQSTADKATGISGGEDDSVNFCLTFEKGKDFEAKSDGSGYADTPELDGYDRVSVTNMIVSVENIGGMPTDGDETAPVIGYVKHYSKAYTAWIGITDDFSGIDASTVNATTVKLISDTTKLHRDPKYSKGDGEIEVTVKQNEFLPGDLIHIEGVKDRAGNVVETQTWEKQEDGSWRKVEEPAETPDAEAPDDEKTEETPVDTPQEGDEPQVEEEPSAGDESQATEEKPSAGEEPLEEESPAGDEPQIENESQPEDDLQATGDEPQSEGESQPEAETTL